MISRPLQLAVKFLKPHIKGSIHKPSIDNFVFKLHTKGTVLLLLIFFFLASFKEYFGDYIKCINDEGVTDKVINNYCFCMSTFTIDTNDNRHLLPGHIPHRGVRPAVGPENKTKYTYYQWVPFVLFLQCVCFYIPHLIWEKEEGGRMTALVSSVELARIAYVTESDVTVNGKAISSRSEMRKKVDLIGKDIMVRLHVTRSWSIYLVSLEVLNFLHIMFQVWVTNKFLNGKFLTLGIDWLQYDPKENTKNPLDALFPLMTKCNFYKFGASGTLMHYDAMCVMSLNILYEKVYAILWFWFLFLFTMSVLGMIWRVVSFVMFSRVPKFTQILYRRVTPGQLDLSVLGYVIERCHYADWLFLYYLAENIPGFLFEELFIRLHDDLRNDEGITDETKLLTLPLRRKT